MFPEYQTLLEGIFSIPRGANLKTGNQERLLLLRSNSLGLFLCTLLLLSLQRRRLRLEFSLLKLEVSISYPELSGYLSSTLAAKRADTDRHTIFEYGFNELGGGGRFRRRHLKPPSGEPCSLGRSVMS